MGAIQASFWVGTLRRLFVNHPGARELCFKHRGPESWFQTVLGLRA